MKYWLLSALMGVFGSVSAIDLSLSISISKNEPQKGDIVTATVKILNQGKDNINGIAVQMAFSEGLKPIKQESTLGKYDAGTQLWTIDNMPATTLSGELTFTLSVQNEGPMAVQSEIMRAMGADVDSTPGNGKLGEDDMAVNYVTVPIVFCGDEAIRLSAEAFNGFSGYQWFCNGEKMEGATDRRITIVKVGRYTCRVNESVGEGEASFPVIVKQVPSVTMDLGGVKEVCIGKNLKISARPKGGTPPFKYQWKNDLGWDMNKPLKTPTTITLTATVTDRNGCKVSDSVQVSVKECE